jgi:S1-C subfamily serine protease
MGKEKMSDDIGETAQRPSQSCPKNFKPWIWALAVMVLFTLGWCVYEAQKRGGYFGRFFKGRTWDNMGGRVDLTALNTAAAPGSARSLQTSYHSIIESVRPAVISIDAVRQGQNANPGDPIANYSRIGSGVIIDPRGYALSSMHVVDGASSLKATVYSPAGALEYPLKIVKGDRASDLVLLRIQGDGPFPHASLGDSNSVRTGDVVISIGSPFGFEQSVTSGIISSRNRTLNVGGMVYENLIQTDSSINKGSSGGPLINAKGDVIAINTAIYSPDGAFAGISFAVPINRSLDLLGGVIDFQNEPPPVASGQLAAWSNTGRQIGNSYRLADGQILTPPHNYRGTCTECHPQFLTPGFVPNFLRPGLVLPAAPGQGPNQVLGQRRYLGPGCQPFPGQALNQVWGQRGCAVAGPNNISLGMTVSDVDAVIAGQNNMMRPGGVFVTNVTPGMPADAGGLQRGDVIIRVDGRKIQDSNSFGTILGAKGGSSINLVILRFGVRRTVKVRMTQRGAAQAVAGTVIKQPTEFTWLGTEIIPLPPGAGKTGVYVAEAGGLLGVAGVKQGDIITRINNTPVTDLYSFINLSKKADTKKGFILDVIRSGNPLFITVKDKIAQNQMTPTPPAQQVV